jgi:hypothetical protein
MSWTLTAAAATTAANTVRDSDFIMDSCFSALQHQSEYDADSQGLVDIHAVLLVRRLEFDSGNY